MCKASSEPYYSPDPTGQVPLTPEPYDLVLPSTLTGQGAFHAGAKEGVEMRRESLLELSDLKGPGTRSSRQGFRKLRDEDP